MGKIIVIIIAMFYPVFLFGQILNLDRTVAVDSANKDKKKYAALIGASLSGFQQKYNFIDEALNYDLTYYVPKNYIFVLAGRDDITTSQVEGEGTEVLQNLGYAHLRFRDNDTRLFSPEPFTQYQWNVTLGLIQRYLLGCNLRIRLMDITKADIYYGVGVMYENEQWNYNGVNDPNLIPPNAGVIKNDFYKTNQYIKASVSINSNCDVVTAIFLQNKIDDFVNVYRISDYLTFNTRISKKLWIALSGDISYDNKPVVPINNVIYSFATTLAIKL